jgi:hypothetical protein
MHPYATDSEERRQVPLGLAVLAILSAYGLAWFLDYTQLEDKLWWLEIPSVAGFYAFYWWLFDRWVWRWRPLRTLHIIHVPDLSGHWRGTGESSYKDAQGNRTKFKVLDVEIRQTWTTMAVWYRLEKSRSHSLVGALTVHDGQYPSLSYEYINDPDPHAVTTMHVHPGMARLELVEATRLEGEYYTGRDRQNYGTLHLVKQ